MIDIDLVRHLHQEVADAVQGEQRRRKAGGAARLAGDEERHFARSAIQRVIASHVAAQLQAGQQTLDTDDESELADAIFARMFGAGRLQKLLDDESIENIDMNGCDEVWVKRAGLDFEERVGPVCGSDAELIELVQQLAAYAGLSSRPFDSANPNLDLQLPDGSRLAAVMSVTARPMVSIRRHRMLDPDMEEIVKSRALTPEAADFLRAVVRGRFNTIIAGGTASGKTTLLRAMASEIDPRERVVTIETSFELALDRQTARHPNCVAMEAREPNSEGAGGVTVAQLVKRTLRLNPDRVIVGEVLGPEIVPMLNVMSQGNDGSLSTIHVDSPRETFGRIASYAQQAEDLPRHVVHEMIAGAVDFVVFINRDRRGAGQRRVRSILEINGYDESVGVQASEIFAPNVDGDAERVQPTAISRLADLEAAGWKSPDGSWGWER